MSLSLTGLRAAIRRRMLAAPETRWVARSNVGWRIEPRSYQWGWDRGTPVHRYYVEQFLASHADDIAGHCLEFQEDLYTSRFAGASVTRLDILHREAGNPRATIIADLTRPTSIPSDTFDNVICTHVLHLIFDLRAFLTEVRRILKPNGTLLVAVPHVSMCDAQYGELWRFTPEGLHAVLADVFGQERVAIQAFGNSLTAAGELRGLVAEEFGADELNTHDARFAVEVCGRAWKAP